MKKKQKKHRMTQKVRKKRPASRTKSAKAKNIGANSELSSVFSESTNENTDVSTYPLTADSIAEKLRSFRDKKPIFEIHSETGILVLPTHDMMWNISNLAGKFLTNKEREREASVSPILRLDTVRMITINTIDKIVIQEDTFDRWSIKITYSIGQEEAVEITLPSELIMDSRDAAIETVVNYLAILMIEDGKDNPENSVQQRTFLFDEATITVGKELFMCTKDLKAKTNNPLNPENFEHDFFQRISDELGGKVTDENIRTLPANYGALLEPAVADSLILGIKKWPLDNDK